MKACMLTMTGTIAHVFEAPKGTNKDGKEYGGGEKVQLVVEIPLQNGETRMDVVTLGTDQGDFFRARQGQQVKLPVGAFPSGKVVQFFILRGVNLADFQPSEAALSGVPSGVQSAARRLEKGDSLLDT